MSGLMECQKYRQDYFESTGTYSWEWDRLCEAFVLINEKRFLTLAKGKKWWPAIAAFRVKSLKPQTLK